MGAIGYDMNRNQIRVKEYFDLRGQRVLTQEWGQIKIQTNSTVEIVNVQAQQKIQYYSL